MTKRQVHKQTTGGLKFSRFIGVKPITDRTAHLSGGYANTFIHLFSGKKALIIDPGVTNDFMFHSYFKSFLKRVDKVFKEKFPDLQYSDIRAFLKYSANGIMLLKELMEANIMVFDSVEDPESHRDIFLERAKNLSEFLDMNGLELVGVFATHHHIDHLGSSNGFAEVSASHSETPVFLPDAEFYTISSMMVGTFPLQFEPVTNYISYSKADIPDELEIYSISGHTHMCGILLPDGCFAAGDLVAPKHALEKIGIIYLEDFPAHLKSLESLKTIPFKYLLIGHSSCVSKPREEALSLVEFNIEQADKVKQALIGKVKAGYASYIYWTADEITSKISDKMDRIRRMAGSIRGLESCVQMLKQQGMNLF